MNEQELNAELRRMTEMKTKVVFNPMGRFEMSAELCAEMAKRGSQYARVQPDGGYDWDRNIPRHDPLLVQVVEAFLMCDFLSRGRTWREQSAEAADILCGLEVEEIQGSIYRIETRRALLTEEEYEAVVAFSPPESWVNAAEREDK